MSRPLSPEARSKMVRAARQILRADGVGACTVEEVARRSGIAKTTIYRHFGGTDALVLAAVDGMVKEAEGPDTGSLRGDLAVIQRGYSEVARIPVMRELFVWMVSRAMSDPQFAAQYRSVRVQPRGQTVLALQRGIARGEVDPSIDMALAIHLIQGPFISKHIIENEEVTDVELDALLDRIVRALAPPPPTGRGPRRPRRPATVIDRDRR